MTEVREFSRVRGQVFVRDRDRRGRITAIGLRTRQGEEYLVLVTPIAEFLRDFLNSEVLASVEFVPGDVEEPCIKVYGFEPMGTEDVRKGSPPRSAFGSRTLA